jgi:hypothetical protein
MTFELEITDCGMVLSCSAHLLTNSVSGYDFESWMPKNCSMNQNASEIERLKRNCAICEDPLKLLVYKLWK